MFWLSKICVMIKGDASFPTYFLTFSVIVIQCLYFTAKSIILYSCELEKNNKVPQRKVPQIGCSPQLSILKNN